MPQIRDVLGVLLLFVVPVIGLVLLQLAIAVVGFSASRIIRSARNVASKPTGNS
jgi:hypothetical protein